MVYAVLIQKEPGRLFRPISGWDSAFTSYAEAEACRERARKAFHDARVVEMTADEAQENGWALAALEES